MSAREEAGRGALNALEHSKLSSIHMFSRVLHYSRLPLMHTHLEMASNLFVSLKDSTPGSRALSDTKHRCRQTDRGGIEPCGSNIGDAQWAFNSTGLRIRVTRKDNPHLAGAQENPRIELAAPAGALWPALYEVIIFTSKVMSAFWTQRRAILFSIFSVRYPGAPLRTMNALTYIAERL